MNSRDRLVYRGLLVLAAFIPVATAVVAAIGLWTVTALFGSLWMVSVVALIHAQTRVLNSGARALRDSVAAGGGAISEDASLRDRLESISDDLAMMRARTNAEPSQDEVRADLVQLAQSLRREVRFLQYSVTVQSQAPSVPASTDSRI